MRRYLIPWALIFVSALSGCAGFIRGVTNSNLHKAPPSHATYTLEAVSAEPIIGHKIERMLHYQMQKLGFRRADISPGDIKVSYVFGVAPAGAVSNAYTFIYRPPQTVTVTENLVTTSPTFTTATTSVRTTRIFLKSIAVRMVDGRTNEVLWEGLTTEEGWCNQIFVTAPAILSLMFKDFPQEQTNVRKTLSIDDGTAREFKSLFSADTNWGCK